VSNPRVVAGLHEQFTSWRAELQGGAERVGWKIGLNVPEVQQALEIEEPVIGYLTSATQLAPGGSFDATGAVSLMAEPEVAVVIGRDVEPGTGMDEAREAIEALAPAIELVDVGVGRGDVQAILAGNVFHRAVVIGQPRPALMDGQLRGALSVGGEEREAGDVPGDLADVVELTARLLGEVGERLQAGDRIIAGALTPQVPVGPGDELVVDLGRLGSVELSVS
jgi:2-keto-4-pentenoate hydratase